MQQEEPHTILQYNNWLKKDNLYARHMKFLLSHRGLSFLHTPIRGLVNLLNIKPHDRILDLGCGRASILSYIHKRIRLFTPTGGVDACQPLISLAQQSNSQGLALSLGSVTHLPFNPGVFDIALCTYVVKHLSSTELLRLFSEVHRVLKPGGRLIIWEFAPSRWRFLTQIYIRVLSITISSEHLRSEAELSSALQESGFGIVQPLKLGLFLYPPVPRVSLMASKITDI